MRKVETPKNNTNLIRWYIPVITAVLFIAFILGFLWLTYGLIEKTQVLVVVIFTVVILLIYEFRRWLRKIITPCLNIIGEEIKIPRSQSRFFFKYVFVLFFTIPFVFYLLAGGQEKTSSVLDFNIIVIAPTLGGLIFAGAGNRRIKNVARMELISVVKKFIVVTVLFIMFRSLAFTVDLTGGIDVNIFDWTTMGIFRGVSFWTAATFFYVGVFLFLLALVDLVLSLRHLHK